MARYLSIDLLAGLASLIFAAVTTLWVPDLGQLVDPAVAMAFALAALARWYVAPKAVASP